jgi:preprotein translocase subunit YajC
MAALVIITVTIGLLYVLFLVPQRRQLRAHQELVASLVEDDQVILSAGIFGRITALGAEELLLEVAPGVELRVARQAVLRRVEHAVPDLGPAAEDDEPIDEIDIRQPDGKNAGLAGDDEGDGPAPGAS